MKLKYTRKEIIKKLIISFNKLAKEADLTCRLKRLHGGYNE